MSRSEKRRNWTNLNRPIAGGGPGFHAAEDQRRIVAEPEQQLSLIDSLHAAVESAQKRSAALRRSILERAFQRRLVSQDPADEPASVLLERIRADRAAAPVER